MSRLSIPVFTLVLLVFGTISGDAQTNNDAEIIGAMFDEPESIQWTRNYNGYIDGFHRISWSIGYDGETFRGFMLLADSGTQVDLIGKEQQNDQVRFEEIDENGRVSGYIICSIHDRKITGDWWSRDFTRQHLVQLTESNLVELEKMEPRVLILASEPNEDAKQLTIHVESSETTFATLFQNGRNERMFGNCTDALCHNFEFEATTTEGSYHLTVQELRAGNYKLSFALSNGQTTSCHATVSTEWPLQRVSKCNYHMLIDAFYPLTGIEGLDTHLSETFTNWRDGIVDNSAPEGPGERWASQASAWMDLTCISEQFVSGLITMWDPSESGYQRTALIYDVNADRLVSCNAFQKRGKDITEEVRQYCQNHIARSAHTRSPDRQSWLERQTFEHLCLTAEGISAYSGFDHVHGEESILIPYDQLDDVLKKSLITKMQR